MPCILVAMAAPAGAVPVSPIDLSQLCGAGDCVVSTNKTIGSASGPLEVGGNFTLSPGVVLEFRVPVHIKVAGNMVLSGTVGAPGHGGDGGSGGDAGQTGGAGGDAPAVVDGIFDVQGSITLSSTAVAVADGGSGGSGGLAGLGQTVGGAGGAGGKAGSLTFNACTSFTSVAGARVLVNGGPGGIGQAGALGGAGGAGGSFIVSAGQAIVVNAPIAALGGDGGNGGAGAGPNGAVGSVTLRASGPITVGSGTLDAGVRTSVSPFQSSVAALSFCAAAEPMPVPTLSEWAMVLLLSLIALFSIGQLRRKYASRATSKSGF